MLKNIIIICAIVELVVSKEICITSDGKIQSLELGTTSIKCGESVNGTITCVELPVGYSRIKKCTVTCTFNENILHEIIAKCYQNTTYAYLQLNALKDKFTKLFPSPDINVTDISMI